MLWAAVVAVPFYTSLLHFNTCWNPVGGCRGSFTLSVNEKSASLYSLVTSLMRELYASPEINRKGHLFMHDFIYLVCVVAARIKHNSSYLFIYLQPGRCVLVRMPTLCWFVALVLCVPRRCFCLMFVFFTGLLHPESGVLRGESLQGAWLRHVGARQ